MIEKIEIFQEMIEFIHSLDLIFHFMFPNVCINYPIIDSGRVE